jgi:hypothetical protein
MAFLDPGAFELSRCAAVAAAWAMLDGTHLVKIEAGLYTGLAMNITVVALARDCAVSKQVLCNHMPTIEIP